ncbi:hypothetical protein Nepgr_012479 [Nepenthes gracilis]|uniref:Uncharacterized protein n=1 Tax=Nepenthes gracilis TaxID=150966 RepID=A0AAD3SG26_NEPGR|nr:hypothetical protein Nepgr_012479 [Nepenthes gracilis]
MHYAVAFDATDLRLWMAVGSWWLLLHWQDMLMLAFRLPFAGLLKVAFEDAKLHGAHSVPGVFPRVDLLVSCCCWNLAGLGYTDGLGCDSSLRTTLDWSGLFDID